MKKIVCLDFDGVIHSYRSGWKGVDIIPDPPVDGAILWLHSLINSPDFKPVIYSSRSKHPEGIKAMYQYLLEHFSNAVGDSDALMLVEQLEFPVQKPAAFLTIDDRAICFDGHFPTLSEMKEFTPWHKKTDEENLCLHVGCRPWFDGRSIYHNRFLE